MRVDYRWTRMTTKADPKPGRWILPLIIIGMVIFTYILVGNISDNTEPVDLDLGLGSSEETTTDDDEVAAGTDTTTTTAVEGVVVDSESVAYLDRITTLNADLATLLSSMTQTNADFDNSAIEYSAARDAIRDDINPAFVAWASEVKASVAPESSPELTALGTQLNGIADAVVGASDDVLSGLQSSDTGEARAAALVDLNVQVAAFNDAVVAANG